jgi:uncharacterized coiled-coil DUF342 family protein
MIENIIRELEDKRNRLNRQAEDHRRKRDKYNNDTKHWAENRTNLNERAKHCLIEANDHKSKRDDINKDVQGAKKERDILNKEYNKLAEKVNQMKKNRLPKEGVSLNKLKREKKKLEFKQMTSVLSPEKERGLVDILKDIEEKIKQRESELETNKEISGAIQDAMKAKDKAELVHKQVNDLAENAQNEHDSMVNLYKEANKCRKEADQSQEKFIQFKEVADQEHNNHIFFIRQVHDYDKVLAAIKRKYRKAKKERTESIAKQQAEDVYEKFKRGEKLSTEDLMVLQKAGYL